jgi:hypothetical protein
MMCARRSCQTFGVKGVVVDFEGAHRRNCPANSRPWWRRIDPFIAVAVALPAIPIIVAVVRAIVDGWIPMGDQALLEIRARDVLTADHPLLGTASSAALNRDAVVPLNHPGPLMFEVLALPVRLFGGGPGVAIGVGAVNLAATTIGTLFAARRSGRAGAALAALAFAGLGWAAGSESLYDPYNPTAAMLACLACLFLAWSTVALDRSAVLWLIGVATFVVELNNSYLLFLTPLVLAVCVIYILRAWRDHVAGVRAVVLGAIAVFVVLWSQPLVEQLLHGGDGNMARMVKASNVLGNNPGPRLGTQIAAATLTLPPWWGRSEFQGIRLFSPVANVALAAGSLALVVVVCAAGCWWAWRRRYGDTAAALLTAVISTTVGWVAAIRSPMSSFFGVSSDYVRWLWPASVFIWFAVGLTVWRFLAPRPHFVAGCRALLIGAAIVIAVVSLANVPRHVSLSGQEELDALRPSAIELIDTAGGSIDVATVLYRQPPNYDVFGPPLLARLQRDGVEFLVDDPVLVRQFGERRRYRGQDVAELRLLTAMEAISAASDPNVVAFVSELSERERLELQTIAIEIEAWLRGGRITLSEIGRTMVDVGLGEPWLGQLADAGLDATSISRSHALAIAVEAGLLDADAEILTTLERFATMRRAVETSTVAVLLVRPERNVVPEEGSG